MTVRGIARRRPVLGSLEKAVLDVLWASEGPLTGRRVHALLAANHPLAYVTVTTVLARLATKNLVLQSRNGRAFRYSALCSHAGTVGAHMADLLGECTAEERRAVVARFLDQLAGEDIGLLDVLLRDHFAAVA